MRSDFLKKVGANDIKLAPTCHVLAEKILDFSFPARKGMFAKEAIARFPCFSIPPQDKLAQQTCTKKDA